MCNSPLNKLKSGIRNGNEIIVNIASNVISYSDDETNFPHIILSTDTKVLRIRKAFANGSSANIRTLEIHLLKMLQLGRCIPLVFNKFFRAALGLAAKVWKSMNLSLGKNISKTHLDEGYNFIQSRYAVV